MRDFPHQRQAQPRALAARARPRQGIKPLEHPGQRVVGHARPAVLHEKSHAARPRRAMEHHLAAGGRKIQRVLQQVDQRLAQQHPLTAQRRDFTLDRQGHPAGRISRPHQVGDFAEQGPRVDRLRVPQRLPRFQRRQLKQPLHDLLDARRLAPDIPHEYFPLLRRHVLVEQLGRAADGRQRRLHLVRQRLRVALDVLPAFQRIAHLLEGFRQRGNLRRARLRRRGRPTVPHILRIDGQALERAGQPGRDPPTRRHHQQRDAPGHPDQAPARAADALGHGRQRPPDPHPADHFPVEPNRRKDAEFVVHHRDVRHRIIFRGNLAAPIHHPGVGLPDVAPGRVEDHPVVPVAGKDPQHLGARRQAGELLHPVLPRDRRRGVGGQIGRRVAHRPPHGLDVAQAHIAQHQPHHGGEPHRGGGDINAKDRRADFHFSSRSE